MAKRSSSRKPIALVGDRIKSRDWTGTLVSNNYTKLFPYKIRWDNGQEAIVKEKEFSLRGYEVLAPEPEAEDIEEEELNLWEQCGDDFSLSWKTGDSEALPPSADRCTTSSECDWQPGELTIIDATDPVNTVVEVSGRPAVLHSKFLRPCQTLEPADSSRESEDSPEQLNLLEGLTGEYQSNMTEMRSQSSVITLTMKSLGETSENFTPAQANTTFVSVDFLAPTHQEPETELELLTYLQNLGQCSASFSESLEKPDPSLSFWNSLPDLSIEDLERGLEHSKWEDIRASIQSSRQRMNLARTSKGSDYLSFPTLLAGHGGKHRDVGLTECEKWWKANVIQEIGSQLSSEAIASLHGFPANWFRSISPQSVAQPVTQDDSQPENSEAKPSQSPKQESPLNGSNGCGRALVESLEKSEEELTPTDTSAIGKHFWCDRLTVAVEVLTIHNWRETPQSPEIIRGARCRPWWNKDKWGNYFPECLTLALNELLEIEAFSSPIPEPDIKNSLEKPRIEPVKESQQVGSLYQYTANRTGKDGIRREYPIIEGRDRDRENDDDWYWGISYIEKVRGKWCDRSASIPSKSLSLVRRLLREKFPLSLTIEACKLKWLWTTEIGSYLIGETKPEVCPRFAILSFEDKELFVTGSGWGELKPASRQRIQGAIQGAIADNKPFSYIKEILSC